MAVALSSSAGHDDDTDDERGCADRLHAAQSLSEHLNPEVATMPLDAAAAGALLEVVVPALVRLRDAGVPVVHVVTSYRDASEITSNPYWSVQAAEGTGPRSRVATHNLDDGSGVELVPGVSSEDALALVSEAAAVPG